MPHTWAAVQDNNHVIVAEDILAEVAKSRVAVEVSAVSIRGTVRLTEVTCKIDSNVRLYEITNLFNRTKLEIWRREEILK